MSNWITAYTNADVEYALKWHSRIPDEVICRELNITEITLNEIINTNPTTNEQ